MKFYIFQLILWVGYISLLKFISDRFGNTNKSVYCMFFYERLKQSRERIIDNDNYMIAFKSVHMNVIYIYTWRRQSLRQWRRQSLNAASHMRAYAYKYFQIGHCMA